MSFCFYETLSARCLVFAINSFDLIPARHFVHLYLCTHQIESSLRPHVFTPIPQQNNPNHLFKRRYEQEIAKDIRKKKNKNKNKKKQRLIQAQITTAGCVHQFDLTPCMCSVGHDCHYSGNSFVVEMLHHERDSECPSQQHCLRGTLVSDGYNAAALIPFYFCFMFLSLSVIGKLGPPALRIHTICTSAKYNA